jgi:triosephosphate isomerase
MTKRKLIAGNWKMNGRKAAATALIAALGEGAFAADVAVCPPFPLLGPVADALAHGSIYLGAQDCSAQGDGAYTGDVCAALLKDMGCRYVILGHSERREIHKESDMLIAAKMAAAHRAGLHVILCVGEKDAEAAQDMKEMTVRIQLRNSMAPGATSANTTIAYEPVWAIGSGLTPTNAQIAAMHAHIRRSLPEGMQAGVRVLYGGSVKADNAAAILKLDGVDGALVGGASLMVADFLKIIAAAA